MKEGYLECSVCKGSGEDGLYVCQKCGGEGVVDWVSDIVYKKRIPSSNLQLVNVRRAVNYVRKTVEEALKENTFELNTMEKLLKPYLDNCKSNRLIYDYDYKIVDCKDNSNKRYIDIIIKPMKITEMIQLNFTVNQKEE